MRAIVSTLLAMSVLTGIATAPAGAASAKEKRKHYSTGILTMPASCRLAASAGGIRRKAKAAPGDEPGSLVAVNVVRRRPSLVPPPCCRPTARAAAAHDLTSTESGCA